MSARLARCRGLLDDLGLDGVVVCEAADVRYLCGFRGEDATLIIGRDAALICTDARYWEQVSEETVGFELVEALGADLIADTAAAAAERLGADARLGFQGASLSYEEHRRLRRRHRGRLRDVGGRVSRLRAVKDAAEIAVMRRAGALTDEALAAVVGRGLVGRREADGPGTSSPSITGWAPTAKPSRRSSRAARTAPRRTRFPGSG